VVWCASSTSSKLGPQRCGVAESCFDGSRRADTLSGVVAVLMYGPVRGFVSVYHSGDGWREVMEETSEECAQDAIFELCRGVGVRGDWGTRPQCLASCVCTSLTDFGGSNL
jgi:hypothetical protein